MAIDKRTRKYPLLKNGVLIANADISSSIEQIIFNTELTSMVVKKE